MVPHRCLVGASSAPHRTASKLVRGRAPGDGGGRENSFALGPRSFITYRHAERRWSERWLIIVGLARWLSARTPRPDSVRASGDVRRIHDNHRNPGPPEAGDPACSPPALLPSRGKWPGVLPFPALSLSITLLPRSPFRRPPRRFRRPPRRATASPLTGPRRFTGLTGHHLPVARPVSPSRDRSPPRGRPSSPGRSGPHSWNPGLAQCSGRSPPRTLTMSSQIIRVWLISVS